jgi:UDP-4-amino-4,6-dideoxy-N-acetyl-beta-L-altrosamine transaminase
MESIPYGRQEVDAEDVRAVSETLLSAWLTTGPKVAEFERTVAGYCGAPHAVAVSSGTAALHAAMHALGIGPGDEVIVPPMTFAATSNAVLYQGGTPVFADVTPGTLCLDPERAARKIGPRTKAIVGVDYAGHPCDWDALRALADKAGIPLVADACHALGAEYRGRKAGTLADITVFSFHPVKHVTTGEGGMAVTADADLAARMRRFRNHGIDSDHRQRTESGTWRYHMEDLGFNYRITDIQCALGISQMSRQPHWLDRRRFLAGAYRVALAGMRGVEPLAEAADCRHAYHLFVVKLADGLPGGDRDAVFQSLRSKGVGVNVHYLPVHLHPYYRRRLGTGEGLCPVAEDAFGRILSLPMFPGLSDGDLACVVAALRSSVQGS